MMNERYELSREKITQIARETIIFPVTEAEEVRECAHNFGTYFHTVAGFLNQMCILFDEILEDAYFQKGLEKLKADNLEMYKEITEPCYEKSFLNPEYASKMLSDEYGRLLSFLYAQLRSVIAPVFEKRMDEFVIHLEVFLEIYTVFSYSFMEYGKPADPKEIKDILYYFFHDYMEDMTMERVREKLDPASDFAYHIVMDSDLEDLSYLYKYGEYISENQIKSAEYLNHATKEQIQLMADTYTEGYRIGFVKGNKDLSKKKVVQIVYPIGFEKMVRAAILNFEKMGLKPVLMRTTHSFFSKRGVSVSGYYAESPNRQFEYDHKEDEALILDKKLMNRKLEAQKAAYEHYKTLAGFMAGPAWIEVFGEMPFSPKHCEKACKFSKKQQELDTFTMGQLGQLINTFIPGEERSFTIIAFPIPEIGEKYEEIMKETIRLNTLDYQTYEDIQQRIIDALDKAEYVCIKGMNGNYTDLKIMLHQLTDSSKQTNFENCVADVNIPVGEVFTSPLLTGTEGVLHVTRVFLNGLEYRDLYINVKDGKSTEYGCSNFEDELQGRKMVAENILFHHESLPMGEFAIGTNTTAYKMGQKYDINDRLPILIAEKTGPHFAFGDTCYSHAEDVKVYNPDGKEIIARDNEISLLRTTDMQKAYFQCHTDITIPYDELGRLYLVTSEGREMDIIVKGRFVLEGTEELNTALDE